MAERADVIIFGASGFTGRRVLREFLRVAPSCGVSLAIAGRSRSKLEAALSWAIGDSQKQQQRQHGSDVAIIEADVTNAISLRAMCARARLVCSCVGPYRLYGEPVVAACVEAGVDYLDVTGEPEFMERMEAKYHSRAVEKGSLIVSACGYDSVPAELGVIFNGKQWEPPSRPSSVDAFVTLHSSKRIRGNFATYESLVLGVGSVQELQELRRSRPRKPRLQVPGMPPKRSPLHYESCIGSWVMKLPSSDAIVVRRTFATMADNPQGLVPSMSEQDRAQWALLNKPVQFGVYFTVSSLWIAVLILLWGFLFYLLASFSYGRALLLRYPEAFTAGAFSKCGPSEEEIESASFTMTFVGRGFRDVSGVLPGKKRATDREIVTRITGPEIGYVTTPIVMSQAALVLLQQRQKLPAGGVYTPGAVFGVTDLQERLEKNGFTFELVSVKDV